MSEKIDSILASRQLSVFPEAVSSLPLPKLTDSEIEIMKAIWDLEPTTVSEVRSEVNRLRGNGKPNLARNTILTQMQRLVKKGWLSAKANGRIHIYDSQFGREEAEKHMASGLRRSLFNGSSLSIVRCLLDDGEITDAEISELQSLISERKKSQAGSKK